MNYDQHVTHVRVNICRMRRTRRLSYIYNRQTAEIKLNHNYPAYIINTIIDLAIFLCHYFYIS